MRRARTHLRDSWADSGRGFRITALEVAHKFNAPSAERGSMFVRLARRVDYTNGQLLRARESRTLTR